MYERPDLAHCKTYLQEVGVAMHHLHVQGIVHQDLKSLNVLRHNGHMLLTDMDAASSLEQGDHAGAKFSSGVLPPEMFVKLETEQQVKQYNDHFAHVDCSSNLWVKIQPMVTASGTYVVRTFNDSDTEGDRSKPLPYSLVKAHPTQDIWAFGQLMFLLLAGQSFVSVNRDEDVSGPEAILQAATWTDESIRAHIQKRRHLIKDDNAVNLLHELLRVDPTKRLQSMADVLSHPFFDKGEHHASKDTKFIEFAKSKNVLRLDDTPTLVMEKWRFRRADRALTGRISTSSLASEEEVGIETDALLELTKTTLQESIKTVGALSEADRTSLSAMVDEETKNFDKVQNSILTNLVISQERDKAEAFDAMFPVLKASVEAKYPKKPPQTHTTAVNLYRQASNATIRFKTVSKILVIH
jgi:hypothetical protein